MMDSRILKAKELEAEAVRLREAVKKDQYAKVRALVVEAARQVREISFDSKRDDVEEALDEVLEVIDD